MDHFSYHSEQIHSSFVNGKGQTRRNIVDIANGDGMKAVEEYTVSGKQLNRKEKKLTAKELECIKKNQFVPGLFKDCIKSLLPKGKGKKRSLTRKRSKSRSKSSK